MTARRTIVVPASSFVDAVLCELSEVTPIPTWELDEDFGERLAPGRPRAARFRKTAHTLAWLRRLGFVRAIYLDHSAAWMIAPTARWRNAGDSSEPVPQREHVGARLKDAWLDLGMVRLPANYVEWSVEVDA